MNFSYLMPESLLCRWCVVCILCSCFLSFVLVLLALVVVMLLSLYVNYVSVPLDFLVLFGALIFPLSLVFWLCFVSLVSVLCFSVTSVGGGNVIPKYIL